jgi:hypothetical protein
MHEHHVRYIHITFGFHDAAFARAASARAKMSLLKPNTFHAHTAVLGVNSNHAALRSLRRTGTTYDLNEVACSNLLHLGIASGGTR